VGDRALHAGERVNSSKCGCHPWNPGELEGLYVDNLMETLLQQKEICSDIIEKFSEVYGTTADSMSPAVKEKTVCRLVSQKMVHDALSVRKAMLAFF